MESSNHRIVTAILNKKNKAGNITTTNFEEHYKAIIIKTA